MDTTAIKNVKRMNIRSKDPKLSCKSKQEDSTAGYIEGYAAIWDVVDHQRERIFRGAFSKSILERVAAKKVPLQIKHFIHGGDAVETIGIITEAKEDDYGLWIHAELSSTSTAQDIRTKVLEGIVNGLSIGLSVLEYDETYTDEGYVIGNIKEARIDEVTVTVKPANEYALITAAKNISDSLPGINIQDIQNGSVPSLLEVFHTLKTKIDSFISTFSEDDNYQGSTAKNMGTCKAASNLGTDNVPTIPTVLEDEECTIMEQDVYLQKIKAGV